MKPISIAFQCFGPYIERQFIDFTGVGENGLFLICGDTGAGKTTILDAISCALYGMATDNKRGRMVSLRGEFAPEDQKTEVEFFFDHNGYTYRFYRSLLPKKKAVPKNLKGEENFAQVEQKKDGGLTDNYHVVFECERKVDGKWIPIWEGSKKGQSANAAKEVLGLSYKQFCQIVILPQGKFETFIMSPSGQKEEILKSLFHTQRWEDAVNKLETAAEEEEQALIQDRAFVRGSLLQNGCETVEELSDFLDATEKREDILLEEMLSAKKLYEAKEQEVRQAQDLAREFADLQSKKQELDEILTRQDAIQEEKRRLKRAETTEALRGAFERYQKAKIEYEEIQGQYAEYVQRCTENEEKLKDIEEKIRNHRNQKIWEKYRGKNIPPLKNEGELRIKLERFSTLCDELIDSNIVSVEDKMHRKSRSTSSNYYRWKEEKEEIYNIIESISDELKEYLTEEIILTREKENIKFEEMECRTAFKEKVWEKKVIDEDWPPEQKRWETALKEKGFTSGEDYISACMESEKKTEIIRACAEYDERLRKAETAYQKGNQKLEGKELPDLEGLQNSQKSLLKQYLDCNTAYEKQRDILSKKDQLLELKTQEEKNQERKLALEQKKAFVKMLKGSNGYGIQRYILGVMLSSVIQEANQILQTVFEGRYTIRRTDEGLGKKGLELAVHSYGEETGRLVKTLSGGEKFIVSLCLAIGLSGVVQAQGGGRVEALFVDEGFGTLDRDRVVDALNILHMTRKNTDMIGIISHVDYLSETIHEKIRVQKSFKGSTIQVEI